MDPLIVIVLVDVLSHEAEHGGGAGEIKVGFTWSMLRTEVSCQQTQTGPNGSRQEDETQWHNATLNNLAKGWCLWAGIYCI